MPIVGKVRSTAVEVSLYLSHSGLGQHPVEKPRTREQRVCGPLLGKQQLHCLDGGVCPTLAGLWENKEELPMFVLAGAPYWSQH